MTRWLRAVLGVGLPLGLTLIGGVGSSAREMRSAQGEIVIHEVQGDPAPSGSESAYEWFELYNPGGESVSLAGWRIADNRGEDELPEVDVAPGGYLVVAGERFGELFPEYQGPLATLSSIGNGLGNDGDQLRLLNPDGREVDAMSYGSDATVLDPPPPAVDSGHSLERVPVGADTDSAADWVDRETPSPGGPGGAAPPRPTEPSPAEPTAAATASPGATAPPQPGPEGWPRVRINEHLPAPKATDWDGDGEANRADEWVELYNAGSTEAHLRGWTLDDVSGGGSSPFVLPDGVSIAPGGHLLLFQRETGVVLNNGGDSVRLLHPDGSVADEHVFDNPGPDRSWARVTDGAAAWVDNLPPSPGRANGDGAPADPPTATVPVPGPTATAPLPTPGGPTATPTPDGPSATGTPPPAYLPFLVSEVMFDPPEPGNDAAYEWVELHNRGDRALSLAGWSVGDRQGWDALGPRRVPAGGFALIVASDQISRTLAARAGAASDVPILLIADGRIGGGLGNKGDVLRLRGPTGAEADAVGWGNALEAFDPAVPIGPPGLSLERLPPDRDTDSAADWWLQTSPSPGRAGEQPEHVAAPPITLNEVLPAPRNVDWDGNGTAGHDDEWLELHNASGRPVQLKGWTVAVGEPPRWRHRMDEDNVIGPHGFIMLHRRESGLHLGNDEDTLRLLRPDGVEADRMRWRSSPGFDRSWSRGVDGARESGWTRELAATPGGPNRPLAEGDRRRADVAEEAARARWRRTWRKREDGGAPIIAVGLHELTRWGRRTRVVVRGRVTAPPGIFGPREMVIGNEQGGVRLYLKRRHHVHRPFVLGDPVAAIGKLSDFRGERQVTLDAPEDAWWDGEGPPVDPALLPTGAIGEATEGRLVRVAGRAVAFGGPRITIDDGSGPARIVWRRLTGLKRPWLPHGAWLEVVGIAGQSDGKAPFDEGYRVVPRFPEDVVIGGRGSARSAPAPGGGIEDVVDGGALSKDRGGGAASCYVRGLAPAMDGPGRWAVCL